MRKRLLVRISIAAVALPCMRSGLHGVVHGSGSQADGKMQIRRPGDVRDTLGTYIQGGKRNVETLRRTHARNGFAVGWFAGCGGRRAAGGKSGTRCASNGPCSGAGHRKHRQKSPRWATRLGFYLDGFGGKDADQGGGSSKLACARRRLRRGGERPPVRAGGGGAIEQRESVCTEIVGEAPGRLARAGVPRSYAACGAACRRSGRK